VYEGGIRVPLAIRWPGRIPADKVLEHPVAGMDLGVTAMAAAGITGARGPRGEELDGVDLLPYMTGQREGAPHAALFWRFGRLSAVRMGNLKLVRREDGAPELYDLAADAGEDRNLATVTPDQVKRLDEAYREWDRKNIPPQWTRAAGREVPAAPPSRPRRQRPPRSG
jgi:arylsulfatase A-like enzyme